MDDDSIRRKDARSSGKTQIRSSAERPPPISMGVAFPAPARDYAQAMRATGIGCGIALLMFAGCSGSSSNRCLEVVCDPAPDGGATAEICDPSDGFCRCGVSLSTGVVCPTGTTCEPVSLTCVSILCAGVNCGDTGTCDPTDGVCRCGGSPGSARVVCPVGTTCEPASQTCLPICFGVTCAAAGASCYGGVCKCGGVNGVECDLSSDSCVADTCQP